MKHLLLTLLIVPTAYGMNMDELNRRLKSAAIMYYDDYPCENIRWNVNDVVQGKTILDLVYLAGRVDLGFVDFMHKIGAKSAYELEMPNFKQRAIFRMSRLVDHITPTTS